MTTRPFDSAAWDAPKLPKTRDDILADFTFAELDAATIGSLDILDEEIALDGAPMIYANILALRSSWPLPQVP